MKRYASIDIGTNTFRLLVADSDGPSGKNPLRPVLYKRVITRLGGGYREDSGISEEAAERSLKALEGFRMDIDAAGRVDEVLSTATSVVRRARNRDRFIAEAKRRAGVDVRVISGDEEARLSLLGVLSALDDSSGKNLVIDIGGGSTEFIAASGGRLAGAWSMEMGVVHLTETHLKSDPPKKDEIHALEMEIKGVLKDLKAKMTSSGIDPATYGRKGDAVFVGTAGTITTLAALDQNLERYDRDLINNYTLRKEKVDTIFKYLASLTLKERQSVLSLEKGREDLIIPGTAITILSMEAFGFDSITVSDAGLLEGIIIDRLKGPRG